MRIIAGEARGRKLAVPKRGTRPMTGRVREAVFSILTGTLHGSSVLDLFAGSGSLGLESLSRGASSALFIENGRIAAKVLRENIERVGLGGTVIEKDVVSFLRSESSEYDLIFVDPPYRDETRNVRGVLELLEGVLSPRGVVVLHRQSRGAVTPPDYLGRVDERRYGDAVIAIMGRVEE